MCCETVALFADSHPTASQFVNPLDPSRPVIQSWQTPTQQMPAPAEYVMAPAANEPFQRAAEIVAAAATEAAAAAASVVVSAASKKIKEQLENLYAQQGVRSGLSRPVCFNSANITTVVCILQCAVFRLFLCYSAQSCFSECFLLLFLCM